MSTDTQIPKTIVSEFVNAVKKVLFINAGEEIESHTLVSDTAAQLPGDISSVIDLKGDLRGKIAVSLPLNYARLITSKIVGCGPDEMIDEDVREGMGEIVNQITGKVRTDLWNYGYRFNISIPELVNGPIEQVKKISLHPTHTIVFNTQFYSFSLQINIQEANII